jgi:hypothetical protein
MSPPRNTPNIGPNNLANEEARMRQALGLRNGPSAGGQVPQRREGEQRGRRFVKDGEVPVVVVNSGSRDASDGSAPVNRIAAAEATARAERGAREQAERALVEAQTVVQHLRTQLAHSEMAHREALAVERNARELAETALREANEARAAAEAQILELSATQRTRRPRPEIVVAGERPVEDDGDPTMPAPRGRVGRPRKVVAATSEDEQEPVQWWLPSFRAGRKR